MFNYLHLQYTHTSRALTQSFYSEVPGSTAAEDCATHVSRQRGSSQGDQRPALLSGQSNLLLHLTFTNIAR
eukprot:6250076-Amphidinium_carterae.1